MTLFAYKVVNSEGLIIKNKVEALNKDEAASIVKEDGLFLVEMKAETKGVFSSLNKVNNFSTVEKINFTDHLATLIKAGTPIKEALEAYIDESGEGSAIIREIVADIERGKKLSDAFAKHPGIFSTLYISLIKAGEIAGNLDETLEYLANELRRENDFIQRVRSSMFYPGLILGVSLSVITFILVFIVPKIIEIAENLGEDIPVMTKIMIAISNFISGNLLYLGLGLVAAVSVFIYLMRNSGFRDKLGEKMLKAPLVGKVMKKYILARLMRIIASCVKYGISLTVAFDTAGEVVGNIKYKRSCTRLNKKVQKGISLSEAISSEGKELFPGIITRSLKGAEKTGGIDAALSRLSLQYEIEVDRDLKKVTELLEPIMVVVLGIVVLFIALSVVMPIYQLTTNLGV
jgi:type II secretory pathway component PulF